MNVYAVVGYLDYETESKLKGIWKDLSVKNITQYGMENKGKRPHITIADYDNLEKNKFIELLDKFYEDKHKISIHLNILGTFLSSGTLFIAPTQLADLLDFHKSHHNYFSVFNENENSFYLPGKWSPHCTIASRLSEYDMMQVFKYCKGNISRICSKLCEIGLVEVEINDNGIAIEEKIIFLKELK